MKILKISAIAVTGLLYSLTPSLARAEGQESAVFGLSPAHVYLQGKPGSTATQEVTLLNQGTQPFAVECYLQDLWFEGEKISVQELGHFKERQAGAWTRCMPNRTLLPPNSRQQIKIAAAIPGSLVGEAYAMMYFEMKPAKELKSPDGNAQTAVLGRLGATILTVASGTEKTEGEIKDATVSSGSQFQTVRFKIRNRGNTRIKGQGTLVFQNGGSEPLKTTFETDSILPGQEKALSTSLTKKLPAGSYQVMLSIIPEKGASFLKEFEINVKG